MPTTTVKRVELLARARCFVLSIALATSVDIDWKRFTLDSIFYILALNISRLLSLLVLLHACPYIAYFV